MAGDQTVQALDRGMAILRMLGKNGRMTASAIGRNLGIHQSSASRLLNSLHKAGFVKKPEFHSFALDYGTLLFAGEALACFPAVQVSANVCNQIAAHTGLNAAVAIMREERMLYLTQADSGPGAALHLINDSDFPVHQSAPGRLLAYQQGKRRALFIFKNSIALANDDVVSAREIYDLVAQSVAQFGFLFIPTPKRTRFKSSMSFMLDGEEAALAVYSSTKKMTPLNVKQILENGVDQILEAIENEGRTNKTFAG